MTLAAPPIPAYRPFAAEVARVQRLSPSFLRVTFTGPSFGDLAPNGFDQRIKVLLPTAAGGLRDCPHGDDWYAEWRALPEDRRNPMRTYTVRAARPEQREIDVDFVLHGSTGPASAWAETAAAGDEVVLVGPNARFEGPTGGFEWRPPAGAAPRCSQVVANRAGDGIGCSSCGPSTSTTARADTPGGSAAAIPLIAGNAVSSPTSRYSSVSAGGWKLLRQP